MTPPRKLIRPVLVAFGQRLRSARLAAGLTQRELARLAGMDRSALQRTEAGRDVLLGTIVLLADALGCDLADLIPRA
jgi:transcriptional regulator with XRE-family HTH domain